MFTSSMYLVCTYYVLDVLIMKQYVPQFCYTLPQVEAFYATIVNSFGHSLMKIGINVFGVEFRILQHLNDLFQLSCSPPVEKNHQI